MTPADRRVLLKAAALFERIAQDIYESNTVTGEWDPEAKADKREHREFISTAVKLRLMAKQPHQASGTEP